MDWKGDLRYWETLDTMKQGLCLVTFKARPAVSESTMSRHTRGKVRVSLEAAACKKEAR